LLWAVAFSVVAAALVARNLIRLDAAPPGLYVDEASIGYNAWAIAHYGVDEHGYHWPLYFQAFGEYKNPIYIYALAPLVRVLPLTAAVERLPAAIFGIAAAFVLTAIAWRMTRSKAIALSILALAALTPWITQQSRVGFEVITILVTLSIALWFIATESQLTRRRLLLAGCFFALSIFAYSAGRLEVLLFTVAFAACYRRQPRWWLLLIPVVVGYAALGAWSLTHPGALTAEFGSVSIASDHPGAGTLVLRFITNYLQYFSPDFLFIHGDANLRHNTGYAGMLLAVTAPLVLLGLWGCWKRRADALPRFSVSALLLSPIAGALTLSSPHALRGVLMVPFLFVIAVYGLVELAGIPRRMRVVPAFVAMSCAALFVQGGLYTLDLYTAYPVRAASAFDTGAVRAMRAAISAASGHTVYVSERLNEQPYIDAFFALLPPPPDTTAGDSTARGLRLLHVTVISPATIARMIGPGDVAVLAADDPRPTYTHRLLTTERAPVDPLSAARAGTALIYVYQSE
jgi:hypothetical protein